MPILLTFEHPGTDQNFVGELSFMSIRSVFQLPARFSAFVLLAAVAGPAAYTQSIHELPDNYQWLEDVNGTRAVS